MAGAFGEASTDVSFTVYSCRVEWYIFAGEKGPWRRLAGGVSCWEHHGPWTAGAATRESPGDTGCDGMEQFTGKRETQR